MQMAHFPWLYVCNTGVLVLWSNLELANNNIFITIKLIQIISNPYGFFFLTFVMSMIGYLDYIIAFLGFSIQYA